jgi:hypothetical protein
LLSESAIGKEDSVTSAGVRRAQNAVLWMR